MGAYHRNMHDNMTFMRQRVGSAEIVRRALRSWGGAVRPKGLGAPVFAARMEFLRKGIRILIQRLSIAGFLVSQSRWGKGIYSVFRLMAGSTMPSVGRQRPSSAPLPPPPRFVPACQYGLAVSPVRFPGSVDRKACAESVAPYVMKKDQRESTDAGVRGTTVMTVVDRGRHSCRGSGLSTTPLQHEYQCK